MRTAIVYYSMAGNTAWTAKKLAEGLDADLIKIRPVKAYPDKGIRKFLWGGKSAVMAETPALESYDFDAGKYDRIVVGFPVWAGNMAPPIRTLVKENRDAIAVKQVFAFACQSGNGAEKAFEKLKACIGHNLSGTMILIDPKDKPKEENDRKIEEFRKALEETK